MAEREGFIMDNVKEKKVTQVEFYGMIREIVEASDVDNKAEILDFVDSRVALIKNRKRSESKASKANVELAERVFDVLEGAEAPMTATEIYNALNGVDGIASSQKVTALIKKLGDRVVKTVEKGKSKFSVAD